MTKGNSILSKYEYGVKHGKKWLRDNNKIEPSWCETLSNLIHQIRKLVNLCLQQAASLPLSTTAVSPHPARLRPSLCTESGTANSASAGAPKVSWSIIAWRLQLARAIKSWVINTYWWRIFVWGVRGTPSAPGEVPRLVNDSLSLAVGFVPGLLCTL